MSSTSSGRSAGSMSAARPASCRIPVFMAYPRHFAVQRCGVSASKCRLMSENLHQGQHVAPDQDEQACTAGQDEQVPDLMEAHDTGPGIWLLDRIQPVSYTHLRAHATRHDLVCRL